MSIDDPLGPSALAPAPTPGARRRHGLGRGTAAPPRRVGRGFFSRADWCVALVVAFGAIVVAPPAESRGADAHESPYAVVRPIGLADVRWTRGLWAERTAALRTIHLPAMWELMRGETHKPFYQHFLIAAGEREGDYHGAPFNDGDFYKFLEAASAALASAPDAQLAAAVDQSIGAIGRAQAADGYLHTPVLIAQRRGDPTVKRFADERNFEMYNMGHLLTAACVHHRATGRENFLAIARRTGDFLIETFRDPSPELARNSVCPAHYMGAVELYRTTGERRYLDLAEKFFDMRSLVVAGDDDNQSRVPFLEQRAAAGHAVRANYLYAGAADLFLETGDARLRAVLDAVWDDVARRKLYVTGACGALYDGASPDGSEDQAHITRVHQAYGRPYQLPNTTAYGETCANIGYVLWNWRMYLATGDGKYVDALETALYNSVLSGAALEEPNYFYVNPLRVTDPLPAPLRWSRTRVPFVTSFCCPPNVLRTLAETGGYAYARSDGAVWVNLYGASELKTTLGGAPLELAQRTDYPWDGRIAIEMKRCPPTEFALRLRVPEWSNGARVLVNGTPASARTTAGFLEIRRRWRPGDEATLELPMPATLLESHPLVEETRQHVAVRRGPVVYCLESVDLPAEVRLDEVIVSRTARFASRRDDALLGGVAALEGDVQVRSRGEWQGRLYRPVGDAAERTVRVRFVPYYAWGNRGAGEMSVWLPTR